MSTVAKPEVWAGTRRVYCQNDEAASLLALQNTSLETLPLPRDFAAEDGNPSVVIGEDLAIFTPELREAIEQNRARLIYVLQQDSSLPPEASGIPVFSFLSPPLQAVVVASARATYPCGNYIGSVTCVAVRHANLPWFMLVDRGSLG